MTDGVSRRKVLRQGLQWPAAGAALLALGACGEGEKKSTACADPNALSVSENQMRKSLNYTEKSADGAKTCAACAFFAAGDTPTACGKCEILQGPVNPAGHCDSWAEKEA
jgi:hypothetical protein